MGKALIQTADDRTAALLRVALGAVMLPHGLQKAFGWFGGGGLGGTIGYFEQVLAVPAVLTVLVIVAESAGALALILGFLSRFAAAGIVLIMAGAVFLVHGQNGFFMNWGGTAAGEGFEYHILAAAMAVAVAIKGGGAWSVDRLLAGRFSDLSLVARPDARARERRAQAA
jgi:putative oxidoreductase